MTNLHGLVAVVTGASGGIGEGLAKMLAEEGVRVVLAARRAEELQRVAEEIRAAGSEALVLPTNMRDEAELLALLERTEQEFGPVDILVNNAGIARNQPIHALNMKHWDLVMEVNVRAPALLCSRVLPGMRERRRGYIINLSSEAGSFVFPGMGAYCISKNALRVMTQLIQEENQDRNIKAWAISPGMVDTAMGADMPGGNVENFLKVEEVVEVVRFLLKQGDNVRMGPEVLIRPMRDPFG
ncbi:MAG: SDR family oxidoreductase [Ardenticatenales bacterium]|nr:SDR family oxidoreductase [Ardenticatenales bacterium]